MKVQSKRNIAAWLLGLIVPAAALFLAFSSSPSVSAEPPPTVTDAVYFTFDDSTGTITGYSDLGPKDVVIPGEIAGVPVTSIGVAAFMEKELTSVVIPDSVTSLGESAFLNNQIHSLVLTGNIKIIGPHAFRDNKLTELAIPDGVEMILNSAFALNELSSLTIPDSVTVLENWVFNTNKLTSLPPGWTDLGTGGSAFANNPLTYILIPEGLETIGRQAMEGNQLRTVTIPESVESVGTFAFRNNELTAATFLNPATTIAANAFTNNPTTMMIIGYPGSTAQTFAGNQGFTFIEIKDIFGFDETTGALTGYSNLGPKEVVIPGKLYGTPVTSIGEEAFKNKGLTRVHLPGSIESIGREAFYQNLLTQVSIPGHVAVIEEYAFTLNQLTALALPDSVTSIGAHAFLNNAIQSLTLSSNLKTIGESAFSGNELTELEIPDGVVSIGANAFNRNQIASLTIPDSVEVLGFRAFAGNLLTDLPPNWTDLGVGGSAFANNLLTHVIIPEGLDVIGRQALEGNQLQVVTVPAGISVIGRHAFRNNELTAAVILNPEAAIDATAFDGNPASLTIVGHPGSTAEAYASAAQKPFLPLLALSHSESYTFPEADAGYGAVTPLTVTVTSHVYGELNLTAVELDGEQSAAFELGAPGSMQLDRTHPQTTFTVYPKSGLGAGTYEASVAVKAEYGILASFGVEFTVAAAGEPDPDESGNDEGNDDTDGNPSTSPGTPVVPDPPVPGHEEEKGVEIIVNGKAESAGTAAAEEVNGQRVTTIILDEEKLLQRLEAEGEGAIVTIPVPADSDVAIGRLNGRMVKQLEARQAVVVLQTEQAAYALPARLIDIDAAARRLGTNLELQDLVLHIEIASLPEEAIQAMEESASANGMKLMAPPLHFRVLAVYDGSAVEISSFNGYVERTMMLPDGVDPNRLTTGAAIEPDGTVRHVPTKITVIDGRYHAQINSLTNSAYSVVWHSAAFTDMAEHWANEAVHDMGSRIIVQGTGNGAFSPDRDMTRAEFAAIMVRGLGLRPESGQRVFTDVHESDWYSEAVRTAYDYQLIGGFADGSFRPNDRITREQAMLIVSRAMAITGLQGMKSGQSAAELLRAFEDVQLVSPWALHGVADTVSAGIVSGRSGDALAPQAYVTRAEVAVIVQRLLQQSDLID